MFSPALFSKEAMAAATIEEAMFGNEDSGQKKLKELAEKKGLTFPLMNEHEIQIGGLTRQIMLELVMAGKSNDVHRLISQAQKAYGYQYLEYEQNRMFAYLGTVFLPPSESIQIDHSIIMHLNDKHIVSQINIKNAIRYSEKEIWLMRKNLPDVFARQIISQIEDKNGPGLMPSQILSIANFDVDAHVEGPAKNYEDHEICDDLITIIYFTPKTTPSSKFLEEIKQTG